MKIFSSLTRLHSRMCIRIFFFVCFKQKNTHTNKKQKKLKKIEKQKKQKKKRRKKMLLLLTISVENLTRYDAVVWEFALCTFNLHDQSTKRERVLKNNKLWKTLVYICLLYLFGYVVYFNHVMLAETCSKNVFIYIFYSPMEISMIHPSFPTFNIKMIEFCTECFFDRMSTLSKALSWIPKNIFQFSYVF